VKTEDKMTPEALTRAIEKHQTAMWHGAQRGPPVVDHQRTERVSVHSLEELNTLTAVAKRQL